MPGGPFVLTCIKFLFCCTICRIYLSIIELQEQITELGRKLEYDNKDTQFRLAHLAILESISGIELISYRVVEQVRLESEGTIEPREPSELQGWSDDLSGAPSLLVDASTDSFTGAITSMLELLQLKVGRPPLALIKL